MERIDFHILAATDAQAAELHVCRLAEIAFDREHRIFIRTRSREQTESLNKLLWTFRQGSFLPHGTTDAAEDEPILLGEQVPAEPQHDLLINLGGDLPPQWERFQRLAEVVESQPDLLAQARARFRSYRQRGYQPETHTIGSKR